MPKSLLLLLLLLLLFPGIPAEAELSRREVRLLFRSGTDALVARKLDEAILFYRNILDSGHNLPEARNNLALAYMQQEKLEQAEQELLQALQINPEYTDALNNLATVYLRRSGFEARALPFAMRAIRIDPRRSSYQDTLGLCYQALKLYDKAEKAYSQAADLNDRDVTPILHLGLLYLERERKAEAVEAFRRVTDVQPDHLAANWNLYRIFVGEKNMAAAKIRFERLFKGIESSETDPVLGREVRETLICHYRSYLTELAVTLARMESRKDLEGEMFINYDQISHTVIRDLVPSQSLFCPTCGKFYTTFVNHVTCPVHGYSEILTESVPEVREMRERYDREICLRCRYGLAFAIARYRLRTGEGVPDDFNRLVQEGDLLDRPVCPAGGNYDVDDKGLIRCDVHGDFENLSLEQAGR